MIQILTAEGERFRSYTEISYRLPESGLILIDGKNEGTSGSNGAGKSTVLDLIFWILFGYLPRGGTADNVIQAGQKSCRGRLELQVGQDLWVIERKRPLKLSVSINGVVQERRPNDLQSMIEEKIMSPERFLVAAYIAQDRTKGFFSMTDAERTQLLSVIANLDQLDKAHDKAKGERDRLRKALDQAEATLAALNQTFTQDSSYVGERKAEHEAILARMLTANTDKEKADVELEDAKKLVIADQKAAVEEAESIFNTGKALNRNEFELALADRLAELKALEEEQLDLQAAISKATVAIDSALEERVRAAREACQRADAQNVAAAKQGALNSSYEAQAKAKMAEADEVIEKGSCKSCNQLLPEAERTKHAQYLMGAAEVLLKQRKEVATIDPAPLMAELNEANALLGAAKAAAAARPQELKNQLAATEKLLSAKQKEILSLETEHKAALGGLERAFRDIVEQADKRAKASLEPYEAKAKLANDVLTRTEQELKAVNEEIARLEKRLVESQNRIVQLEREKALLADDAALHEELVLLFGPKGYRAVCFDALLDRISSVAGDILSRLSDGVFTTRLEQLKDDSKGNSKIVLKPVILRGGEEVALDFLSGGFARRAALAYDLAINEVASDGLFLALDEGLNSLDSVGKAEALPVLQEMAQRRAIFVIDHTSELLSAIDTVWTARNVNGVSSLER